MIIDLWKSCFGDSEDEITYFINNVKNADCLAYFENDVPISMMFLVDCCVNNENGRYVYAACTDNRYRGRGIMTKLLEYAKHLDYSFLCLIPAEDSLEKYYCERGFNKKLDVSELEFEQTDEINEYLLEGYKLTFPKALMFKGE